MPKLDKFGNVADEVVKSEILAMGRFLITLKWACDFIDTKEGQKAIEMIEKGDSLGAQKLIFESLITQEQT